MKNMKTDFGNGRVSVIHELNNYIKKEISKIKKIRCDEKTLQGTHKKATLSGNIIALSRIRSLLEKKLNNAYKKEQEL